MNKENLEMLFQNQVEIAQKKIEEQMEIARKAIYKACDISEEYGVPFYGISDLSQAYGPSEHIREKFVKEHKLLHDEYGDNFLEDLDSKFDALIDKYEIHQPQYEGWQHSDIC